MSSSARGRRTEDPVRPKRRGSPRVSRVRRGRARHRRDRELGPPRRGVLGVPELARQRRRLAAIGRLIMLDRRGHRPLGSGGARAAARPGDPGAGRHRGRWMPRAASRPRSSGSTTAARSRCSSPRRTPNGVGRSCSGTRPPGHPARPTTRGVRPKQVLLDLVERQAADWADNDPSYLRTLVPSRADDERFLAVAGRPRAHARSRPGTVAHFFRETVLADLRGVPRRRAGADARAATRAGSDRQPGDGSLRRRPHRRTRGTWRSTAPITSGSASTATTWSTRSRSS